MSKFAEGTSVPVDRSRAEMERILMKYGADQFSSGWTAEKAVIMFRLRARYVRVEMPLALAGKTWGPNKGKHLHSQDSAAKENRRRWRALVLYVKAKLESVESEIVSFEQAFMAHIVLPNKQTVGEFMQPQIESAYQSGQMPKQLPGF
jgi:hypothetical protein